MDTGATLLIKGLAPCQDFPDGLCFEFSQGTRPIAEAFGSARVLASLFGVPAKLAAVRRTVLQKRYVQNVSEHLMRWKKAIGSLAA
jgi:hypothetical protein